MSTTISIDDEVFDRLKSQAEPLVDTANTVLRRILGLGEVHGELIDGGGRAGDDVPRPSLAEARGARRQRKAPARAQRQPRARPGTILADDQYEIPLLEIIEKHGGRAATREVLDELETRLGDRFTEVDRETLATGIVRWRNRAQFVRLRLVQQGDMVADSPRGIWEITAQGRQRIAKAA